MEKTVIKYANKIREYLNKQYEMIKCFEDYQQKNYALEDYFQDIDNCILEETENLIIELEKISKTS